MPWRLRSSMTMSRKSIESSWSWSRRRTSGFTFDRSSSGAMSAMMSRTTCLHSSLVIVGWCAELGDKPLNNQRGIYPEHAKGVIKDRIHFRNPTGVIQHQARQGAKRIEMIDVDRGMDR